MFDNQTPISYEGNDNYIFISYSHKDKDEVWQVINELIRRGYRVWYDNGIHCGSEYNDVIAKKLKKCSVVLAFNSEAFFNSTYCKNEILYADGEKIPVINIMYADRSNIPDWFNLVFKYTYQIISRGKFNSINALVNEIVKSEHLISCKGLIPSNQNQNNITNNNNTYSNNKEEYKPDYESIFFKIKRTFSSIIDVITNKKTVKDKSFTTAFRIWLLVIITLFIVLFFNQYVNILKTSKYSFILDLCVFPFNIIISIIVLLFKFIMLLFGGGYWWLSLYNTFIIKGPIINTIVIGFAVIVVFFIKYNSYTYKK